MPAFTSPNSSNHEATQSRDLVGRHLLADISGVKKELLQDETELMNTLVEAVQRAGCQVLSQRSHKFPGPHAGVTGVVLLSESHAAFHSYPELGYLALDVFVCGGADPRGVVTQFQEALSPKHVDVQVLSRRRT